MVRVTARHGSITLRSIIQKPGKYISKAKEIPCMDKDELTIET
jgi:hypothetical protein